MAKKIKQRKDTYFIGSYRGRKLVAIKIGIVTRGQLDARVRNLQTGSVDRLKLLGYVEGSWERKFHRKFAKTRLRGRRSEFFDPTPELLKMVKHLNSIRLLLAEWEEAQPVAEDDASATHKE